MMQGIWLIILDELWWLYGVRMHGLATGAATPPPQRLSRRTEGDQIEPTEGADSPRGQGEGGEMTTCLLHSR